MQTARFSGSHLSAEKHMNIFETDVEVICCSADIVSIFNQ